MHSEKVCPLVNWLHVRDAVESRLIRYSQINKLHFEAAERAVDWRSPTQFVFIYLCGSRMDGYAAVISVFCLLFTKLFHRTVCVYPRRFGDEHLPTRQCFFSCYKPATDTLDIPFFFFCSFGWRVMRVLIGSVVFFSLRSLLSWCLCE